MCVCSCFYYFVFVHLMVLLLGVIPCKSSFWWMNQLVEVCVCLHSCTNKKAAFFYFQAMST
jgi:hypothetical protein